MKKLVPILLGLAAVLLFVVGTAAGSKLHAPMVKTTDEGELIVLAPPDTLIEEMQSFVSLEMEDAVANLKAQVQQDTDLEAKIKVDGDVYYCDCETADTCQFVEFEKNNQDIAEGDTIRTGEDGSATITFGNEVELVLARNTQVRILKFETGEDGITRIYIEQIVGEAYFSVKYSKKESQRYDFKILTPTALVEQVEKEGKYTFSGISTVEYENFAGMTPAELAEAIDDTFTDECGNLCIEDDCSNCMTFAGLVPIDLQVDDLTGNLRIIYINEDGLGESIIFPGQTLLYNFDGFDDDDTWELLCEALKTLLVNGTLTTEEIDDIADGTTGENEPTFPPSTCGDGVCSIYDNEDKKNCPEDCK